MKARYLVLGVVGMAAVAVFYRSLLHGEMDMNHDPHSVQSTAQVEAATLVDVEVPELSATAQAGKEVFQANCAVCHGVNAAGGDGAAPPLVHIIYEPNHHSDQSFYQAVRYGVRAHHWRFGNMPPIEGVDQDRVSDLITYIRELQRANGIF